MHRIRFTRLRDRLSHGIGRGRRAWRAAGGRFRAVAGDSRGAVAMIFALAIIPVFASVGLAVDSSLGYILKSRLSKSLDIAGLAAGRLALNANATDIAREYFDANFGEDGSVVVTDFDFDLSDDRRFIDLTAEAETPTVFMRIFGKPQMSVTATTRIERQTTGMELALVMDNTGSMWANLLTLPGTPFEAMQNAALDLVDIIYGDETEIDNVWISLVPYVATVNIGNGRTDWLNPTDQVLTNPAAFDSEGWKGCVMARAAPYDGDDTPPADQKFSSFLYPQTTTDNNWPTINSSYTASNQAAKGPNLACGGPITGLTDSRASIDAGIGAMKPWRRGGTAGNLGLAWGWRTISPRWRGLWGGDADLPLDYRTENISKVVVMLTDGNNEFYNLPNGEGGDPATPSDFTAYGRVNAPGPVGLAAATTAAGVTILNNRMSATCQAMKAEDITIYTIIFGGAPNAATRDLYEDCASNPGMYYYAPTNAQLATAFQAIGGQLANLRIVQ